MYTEETKNLHAPPELRDNDTLQVDTSKDGSGFILQMYGDAGLYKNRSSTRALQWLQRFPEAKDISGGSNTVTITYVPQTDISASLIRTWPQGQRKFTSDALVAIRYLALTSRSQELAAEAVARYKAVKSLPGNPYIELHPTKPLACYQQLGAHNVAQSEGYGLFMEQGTGKTPTIVGAIDAMVRELQESDPDHYHFSLGILPPAVRTNWLNEICEFTTLKPNVVIIKGDKYARLEAWIRGRVATNFTNSIMLISYDVLEQCQPLLQRIEWDFVFADESQAFKNPKSKRFKNMLKIRDAAKKRAVLTGTPIANGIFDLYTQLEFMGEGFSGFSNFESFKKFYGVFETTEGGFERFISAQNLPFLHERLAKCSFSITKREAMPDLPEKLYSSLECEMGTQQETIYKQVAQQLYAEIEDDLDKSNNQSLTATNALTKLLRLAQITSGFVTWDAKFDDEGELLQAKQIDRLDPNPKLELLVEQLKALPRTSKAIVWACWHQDIKSIAARLQLEGIDHVTYHGKCSDNEKAGAQARFNKNPLCKVFVGNAASGGTGLNLHGYDLDREDLHDCNCDHIYYYSQNWSSLQRRQSEDRAHRRRTRVNVNIVDLCVPGTIDEEIRTRVLKKQEMALLASDVRSILKAVLKR